MTTMPRPHPKITVKASAQDGNSYSRIISGITKKKRNPKTFTSATVDKQIISPFRRRKRDSATWGLIDYLGGETPTAPPLTEIVLNDDGTVTEKGFSAGQPNVNGGSKGSTPLPDDKDPNDYVLNDDGTVTRKPESEKLKEGVLTTINNIPLIVLLGTGGMAAGIEWIKPNIVSKIAIVSTAGLLAGKAYIYLAYGGKNSKVKGLYRPATMSSNHWYDVLDDGNHWWSIHKDDSGVVKVVKFGGQSITFPFRFTGNVIAKVEAFGKFLDKLG
jgi:hypothetical protein